MRPVFLVGFMCSGKSTLGDALARECSMAYADLDDMVEEMAGMPVPRIFAAKGEEEFRRIERRALERACSLTDTVVATGGGTPCAPGAMELMNACGVTVHLHANIGRLAERMMEGRDKRPLLAGIDSEDGMAALAQQLLGRRSASYEKAALSFDSSMLETEQQIADSAKRLRALLCEYGFIPNE